MIDEAERQRSPAAPALPLVRLRVRSVWALPHGQRRSDMHGDGRGRKLQGFGLKVLPALCILSHTCKRTLACHLAQVDYSGFSTINTQRFGQKFVGKVRFWLWGTGRLVDNSGDSTPSSRPGDASADWLSLELGNPRLPAASAKPRFSAPTRRAA